MLHYELEKKKGSSLYEELYQKLKEDILRGRILPGTKLPSKIAEPFPPGGQKLSALCAARPWIFVSDIRSFHPLRAKVESSAGVEPAPSRRAAGAHPHAPAAHIGGLFFPGTPSGSRHDK